MAIPAGTSELSLPFAVLAKELHDSRPEWATHIKVEVNNAELTQEVDTNNNAAYRRIPKILFMGLGVQWPDIPGPLSASGLDGVGGLWGS